MVALLRLLHQHPLPDHHLWVGLVPSVDHLLSLLASALQLQGKTSGSEPVGYSEVHSFGMAPLRRELILDQGDGAVALGRLLQGHHALLHGPAHVLVHADRGLRVEVGAALQAGDHGLALAQVRQDADVQLAVVGNNEAPKSNALDGVPHVISISFQGRQLLEVRIAGREAAGRGIEVEARVQSPLARHLHRQLCEEGRQRFLDGRHLAPVGQADAALRSEMRFGRAEDASRWVLAREPHQVGGAERDLSVRCPPSSSAHWHPESAHQHTGDCLGGAVFKQEAG
mmetsp:Transcript_81729/g.239917  ORF Transcript_81729/g.239917 Transcript_81729/m.239917 type:complete len:284 (+) Transcript_81729:477-1328(+)